MKRFSLCADDYALSPEVNEGTLALLRAGRIHAVSCLTESRHWPAAAKQLHDCESEFEVGLHFNLTLPFGQTERKITSLLARSATGTIDRAWVRRRLNTQWEQFLRHYGRMPDFLDGHQHVHAFPGVREVMIQFLRQWHWQGWIRTLDSPVRFAADGVKGRLLTRVAEPLSGLLEFAGMRSNPAFAGFRPYRTSHCFRSSFRQWLKDAPDCALLMCHPGMGGPDDDPIRACRVQELRYLASEELVHDCSERNVTLGAPATIVGMIRSDAPCAAMAGGILPAVKDGRAAL